MFRLRLLLMLIGLTVPVVIGACGARPAEDPQAAIEAAVQATLTAVAASPAAPPTTPGPTAAVATPRPTPAVQVILPPAIPNFTATERPAATKGQADAPLVMYEWADYTCPYCRRFHSEVLPTLEEQYIRTGKLRLVYKEYPVVSGDLSVIASLGAQCAAEQNGFWPMHDWLFEQTEAWRNQNAIERIKAAAVELGLDGEAFNRCFDEQTAIPLIVEDYREGQALGIRGTPNFVINGHWVQGLLPLSDFVSILDALLAQAETGSLPEYVITVTPSPTPDTDFADEPQPPLGDANAPVLIVEFSDYQCPFCLRHFQQTMPKLREQYIDTGKVRYVFKDFPLDSIHPQARKAAEAANCAGKQGQYWPMHDRLFAEQNRWAENNEAVTVFKQLATELGLDAAAFAACLDGGETAAEIEEDLQEGLLAGVQGTPAFFINGRFISGAQPFEVFQQVIEQMLAP
ncbi:MAG: DsbA family protein [Anaerolineae bacterium]|nr:DsbA family protein [Caldilineales bacterium]MDW8268182.1 DsbA family protein [Anaerolineae bacterium]